MIVFLAEEESMKVTLERLIARCWPSKVQGVDWIALSFQGKNDLEKNIAPKMKSWNYGTPHFVILRDQDGSDCKFLKTKLCEIAAKGGAHLYGQSGLQRIGKLVPGRTRICRGRVSCV